MRRLLFLTGFVLATALLQARDDDDLDEVMSGYLEVPEQLGHAAFCASLVDAIRSGAVTLESLQIIAGRRDDAAMFFEVGRLLRAIYFSHRATTTAATTAEVPQ